MNILLDLNDDEITELMNKLNAKPVSKSLLKKFEQAVVDGDNSLFNWTEIPEDKKDIPDNVVFGRFGLKLRSDDTHYFVNVGTEG